MHCTLDWRKRKLELEESIFYRGSRNKLIYIWVEGNWHHFWSSDHELMHSHKLTMLRMCAYICKQALTIHSEMMMSTFSTGRLMSSMRPLISVILSSNWLDLWETCRSQTSFLSRSIQQKVPFVVLLFTLQTLKNPITTHRFFSCEHNTDIQYYQLQKPNLILWTCQQPGQISGHQLIQVPIFTFLGFVLWTMKLFFQSYEAGYLLTEVNHHGNLWWSANPLRSTLRSR